MTECRHSGGTRVVIAGQKWLSGCHHRPEVALEGEGSNRHVKRGTQSKIGAPGGPTVGRALDVALVPGSWKYLVLGAGPPVVALCLGAATAGACRNGGRTRPIRRPKQRFLHLNSNNKNYLKLYIIYIFNILFYSFKSFYKY